MVSLDSSNNPDLTPFIDTAEMIVGQVCVTDPATKVSIGYADNQLELIERWLAAHFYAILDPRYQSQTFGGAGGTTQGQTAMNFAGTTYGQQAMLLDTNGGLAWLSEHRAKGKRGKVGIISLASTDCDSGSDSYQEHE